MEMMQSSAEEIQNMVYSVGKESGMELKDWFSCLYQVLLGSQQGQGSVLCSPLWCKRDYRDDK